MTEHEAASDLLDYLENVPDDALVMAFVRYARAWQQVKGETEGDAARRQRIEKAMCALIAADPVRRVPLAVTADLEEPGPVPRLIMDQAQNWLTAGLVRQLLNAIPGLDERYHPLMRYCAERAIADGAEDGQTVVLYISSLRHAGETAEAERLALKALDVAEGSGEDMVEIDTLLSILAEIAFDGDRFEDALSFWHRRLDRAVRDPALRPSILNNCGAALQHMGQPTNAGRAFREAAREARRQGPDDPTALRALGSAYINAAMQALERGRSEAAVDLARRGTEHYRDLLARHEGHSDDDIVDLYSPLVSALEETERLDEASALTQEMLSFARSRYRQAPDVAAAGLAEVLRALHQDALSLGRYDDAAVLSAELRALAERHEGEAFGMVGVHAGLALAAEADGAFLSGESEVALVIYEKVEAMLPDPPPTALAVEIFGTRLNHAMALSDTSRHGQAADAIRTLIPIIEAAAVRNGWLWALVARGYANLAVVDGSRGRVEEARGAIDRAEQAFAQVRAGNRSQRIDAIEQANAIGNSLSHIGEQEASARMLHEAIAGARALEQHAHDPAIPMLLFSALNDLGLTHFAAGRDLEAVEAFTEASQVAKQAPEGVMIADRVAHVLVNRAAALLEAHRFEAARETLDEAADIMEPGGRGWTDYLNTRAAVHSGQDDYEQALALFLDAHEAAEALEDVARAALNIAKTFGDLERWAEARAEAMSLVEALHSSVVDPDGVEPLILSFWLSAQVVAARAAVFVEPPGLAVRETSNALKAVETLAPSMDRDLTPLRGYAFEAWGDALAADAQHGEARVAWAKARSLFEAEDPSRMHREIRRLTAKETSHEQNRRAPDR